MTCSGDPHVINYPVEKMKLKHKDQSRNKVPAQTEADLVV